MPHPGTASADDAGVALAAPDSSAVRQAEQRGQQIVRELQARALAERGYALTPDELVTTLGATTTLPGDVIARLARADSEDRVAWGAERTRADDLGSASAASLPRGIAHGEYVAAAAQDRLTADTATAHAAGDRSAALAGCRELPVHRRQRGHRSGYRRNPGGTIRHSYEHDPECPPSWPFCVRH